MPLADLDAFHFQFFLRLPKHHRIASTESTFPLPGFWQHDRMTLRSESGAALDEAMLLVLAGHGYETADDATAAALRAREAFSLAALQCGVGIEWEQPTAPPTIWKGIRGYCRVQGTVGAATLVGGVGAEWFSERFAEWTARNVELTPRQKRCAELLADFHFDMSSRSRFLLAHAAIEELAPKPMKDVIYREAVAHLSACLYAANLDPHVKMQLGRRLAGLAYVSDTNRCKQYIGSLLGHEALRDFSNLTRKRGRIAHAGESDEQHRSFQLHRLAMELLLKSIGTQDLDP